MLLTVVWILHSLLFFACFIFWKWILLLQRLFNWTLFKKTSVFWVVTDVAVFVVVLLLLLLLLLLLPCLFLIITLYVDSVLFGFTEQGRVYPEGDHARVPWCGGSKSRHRRSVTWFLIWIKNKISFWTPAQNNMVLNL